MKRFLIILLTFLLLLCGCAGVETDPEAKALKDVLKEFERRVDEAASSDELEYIQFADVIITDKDMIKQWLTALQKLELEPQVFNGSQHILWGGAFCPITFGYPDKTVTLGGFQPQLIYVYYDGKTGLPNYVLEVLNLETGTHIMELADECGYVFTRP